MKIMILNNETLQTFCSGINVNFFACWLVELAVSNKIAYMPSAVLTFSKKVNEYHIMKIKKQNKCKWYIFIFFYILFAAA